MASGKKNYFRHSFLARKHPAIAGLIDDHGKEAYFHFFALVELCAEQASDGFPPGGRFVFRRSTLCRELLVTNSRLSHHLLVTTPSLVDHILVTEKEVEILFPKLAKYMGKYETKLPSNSPNKRKEKEIKENKTKEGEEFVWCGVSPDEIVQAWNDRFGQVLGYCHGLGAAKHRDNFFTSAGFLTSKDDWVRLFDKVEESDLLMGKGDKGWKASLLWLVNYDNALRVLSDEFKSGADMKHLFSKLSEYDT